MYDRSALILDTEDHRLAQASMSLIVLGHRPLYAVDLDELALLASERRSQVGALLLPSQRACKWWPALRKRIVEPIGLAPRSVLPVGERLADADAGALHCDGLRWALWEPFSPWELRFAVSLVLSETDPNELRVEARVPCSVAAEVESHSRKIQAQLTDLSAGGAFVQLSHPPREGTPIAVRCALAGQPVSLAARVTWCSGPNAPSWRDRGMGVAFEQLDLETFALLRRQMERALDRFRLIESPQ
jgi:uncharacterized protein (TIGR02266 family)